MPVLEDLGDCSVLIGIKEVPVEFILQDKVYFIFSHTIKKQSHNRKLLQRMLEYHNHLMDYEVVVVDKVSDLLLLGILQAWLERIMPYGHSANVRANTPCEGCMRREIMRR